MRPHKDSKGSFKLAVELHGVLGCVLVVSSYKPLQEETLAQDLDVFFGAHRRVIMTSDLNCTPLSCLYPQ